MKKIPLKVSLSLLCVLLLTGCDSAALDKISDEISSIQTKLIPNWVSFVVQIAALAILILVVVFCAYKPVKKMLKKRQDYIENNISESEKNKTLSLQREQQSKEIILESKKQAASIIEEAKKSALKEQEHIVNKTKIEVQKMKEEAEKDIELSKKEAIDEIHSEMVEVALEASKEILKREISKEDNARIAEQFIKDLD